MTKAFDTLDHGILIKKLNHLGIESTNLQWFRSYLSDRRQHVKQGETLSDPLQITRGVPQGSILGPLLFTLYTNDLPNCHNAFSVSFADDISILINDKNPINLSTRSERVLSDILNWLKVNKLSLNMQKTSYIIFSNKHIGENFQISTSGNILHRTQTAKILGVTIDEKLTFKHHTRQILNKLSKGMYVLIKLAKFVPLNIFKKVYYSTIYPHLIYCLPVYGVASPYIIKPIITMQKKFVRLLSGSRDFHCHISPLFRKQKMLKFPDLLKHSLLKIIYQSLNKQTCKFLQQKFQPIETRRQANLRSNSKLCEPFYQLTRCKQSVVYRSTRLYNNLPQELKNEKLPIIFSKKFKSRTVSQYSLPLTQ